MDVVLDIVLDAVKDTLLLVPFLLATYLVMEWLEHKTSEAIRQSIGTAGASGPVIGAFLGIVPQCGFSAATATLYSSDQFSSPVIDAVSFTTRPSLNLMAFS